VLVVQDVHLLAVVALLLLLVEVDKTMRLTE
jgi:hypothetical protein